MTERPILFSAPMVRAILEGRKTQTRRVAIKTSQPRNVYITDFDAAEAKIEIENKVSGMSYWKQCPYGQSGDRLWVREAFRFLDSFDGDSPARVGDLCLIAGYPKPWAPTQYEADGGRDNWMNVGTAPGSVTAGKLRPGIHMPRWASRILLEITAVRVERLHDISEADAQAEGAYTDPACPAYDAFELLWKSINGDGSWEANPWVWVVEFKRVQP